MKRKTRMILLAVLIFLFLVSLGSGAYFLLKPRNLAPMLDKYSDILNSCSTKSDDKTLTLDCKALLVSINSAEEDKDCFDLEIITKNKELKDISICESRNSISYSNDLLRYERLMPIDIIFTYTEEAITSRYLLENISLSRLENTYVQSIINDDITALISIDSNSTTIKNSVNFCPRPESLPDYISEENKVKYSNFYAQNALTISQFQNSYIYNIDDSVVRTLFACDSMMISGYTKNCPTIGIINSPKLIEAITDLPPVPNWDIDIEEDAITTLKKLSLLYDSMNLVTFANETEFAENVIDFAKLYNHSEEIFCATSKLISRLKPDDVVSNYKNYVNNIISENTQNIKTAICESTIQEIPGISKMGLYLSILYKNLGIKNATIMNRCYNLNFIFNND